MSSQPHETHASGSGKGLKLPDDPSIRVELSESFRQDLARGEQTRLADHVLSPGRPGALHPSSVSRYIRGKIAPTLLVARRLASAAGRPFAEAVAAYSSRHGRRTARWALEMFSTPHFRERVAAFLDLFGNMLDFVHFGFPDDAERPYRRVVRPPRDAAEYVYCTIALAEVDGGQLPVDFVLSYEVFESPTIYSDYARISFTEFNVEGRELWTGRRCSASRHLGLTDFVVATWNDGKAVDFVVRSSVPFLVGPMLPELEQLPNRSAVIRFEPGGIHRHYPAPDSSCRTSAER